MTQQEINFFNNIAPRWDSMEIRSVPERINHILDMIEIMEGMRVADLGTGTGVLTPYLSSRVGKGGSVLAVDGSEGMLALARRKFEKSLENVEFLLSDFEEEPLEGHFDRILLYCVYPHLQRPVETLSRFRDDNLTDDGRIVIAFPNGEQFVNSIHHHNGSEADILSSAPALALELFEEGFQSRVVEYSPDAYIVTIRK